MSRFPSVTAMPSPLPPGPRLPRWLQTAGFIFAPIPWIDSCRRRYGEMVTFSFALTSGWSLTSTSWVPTSLSGSGRCTCLRSSW